MENNYDYYEPTITTTRNDNYYQLDYADELSKLAVEKQRLIIWLKDKIENITNYGASFGLFIDKDISHEIDIKKQIYQEVLNYVKGEE